MKDLYDIYADMLCAYMDAREVYRAVRKTSANGTHIKEAKIIMEFNRSQMQIAFDKYLLYVVAKGAK